MWAATSRRRSSTETVAAWRRRASNDGIDGLGALDRDTPAPVVAKAVGAPAPATEAALPVTTGVGAADESIADADIVDVDACREDAGDPPPGPAGDEEGREGGCGSEGTDADYEGCEGEGTDADDGGVDGCRGGRNGALSRCMSIGPTAATSV